MRQVIAMHGWLSNSSFWQEWKAFFQSEGWLWQNIERGYGYIDPFEPCWKNTTTNPTEQKRVVFCHSLGTHLIASHLLREASDVVLLNSFSRFIPNNNERRSLIIGLNGMQRHLGQQTEKAMFQKFLQKANKPCTGIDFFQETFKEGVSLQGRKKLKADLELLINSDKLPKGLNRKARVLIIHGEKDQIVTSATRQLLLDDLNQHLDQPAITWNIEKEGHFIRLPSLINRVNDWLRST